MDGHVLAVEPTITASPETKPSLWWRPMPESMPGKTRRDMERTPGRLDRLLTEGLAPEG